MYRLKRKCTYHKIFPLEMGFFMSFQLEVCVEWPVASCKITLEIWKNRLFWQVLQMWTTKKWVNSSVELFTENTYSKFKMSCQCVNRALAFQVQSQMEKISWDLRLTIQHINPLNPELNPICYLLALLGAHHFLHVSRIRVKSLTLRVLMSYIYIYGAPILDVSRSHTTMQHSR